MSEPTPPTESEIVELVRSIDVRAPRELHGRIEAMVAERAPARARRPAAIRWGLAGAPLLCAIAVVLIVVLSSVSGGSPLTLRTAVALTMRPQTLSAPARNPHDRTELAANVEGVPFPYWEDRFGWRSTGERVDRVGGRTVRTVFYATSHHEWLGYAIVAGSPAPRVTGGVLIHRDGNSYRLTHEAGVEVVTWLRDGRLCVVAGHRVSSATLLSLASWRDDASTSAS
jgi:hypothetical protein